MNLTTNFNPFMIRLLRAPLHKIASKNTLLITFTGCNSGRRYTTPVNYVLDGNPKLGDVAQAAKERVMILLDWNDKNAICC